MDLKINVKTPHGQAESCMKTQRQALLGFKKASRIKEEKLISDNEFYWIVPAKDDKDMAFMLKRLARGEIWIKKFYRTLIKTIDRANKLAAKFKRGAKWIRNWMVKKLRKQYDASDPDGLIAKVQSMSDEEIKEFIQINDKQEMQELLAGELITTKEMAET